MGEVAFLLPSRFRFDEDRESGSAVGDEACNIVIRSHVVDR
jgi:hypothetical protein